MKPAQVKLMFDYSGIVKERLHRQVAADTSTGGVAAAVVLSDVAEGAWKGDFSERDTRGKVLGQIGVGLMPFIGQAADARDTAAAIKDVSDGKAGGTLSLGAAVIGWVPVVGDAAKAWLKAGRKILKETAEEAAERAIKNGIDAATSATEHAAKELAISTQMNELAARRHDSHRRGF